MKKRLIVMITKYIIDNNIVNVKIYPIWRDMPLNHLKQKFLSMIPHHKPVLFVCIGTDRVSGDSLGPLVGTELEKMGYDVLGTLENPVHGKNLHEIPQFIKKKYRHHFIVAIDACLGPKEDIGEVRIYKGPLRPGAGVNKLLPPIGHMHIVGIVNYSGSQEYLLLDQTDRSFVQRMAVEIQDICCSYHPQLVPVPSAKPGLLTRVMSSMKRRVASMQGDSLLGSAKII